MITFEKQLTRMRGDRVIDIRYLGRAHLAADIVVHLPKENIVIAGDVVVWPIPLFGSMSFPILTSGQRQVVTGNGWFQSANFRMAPLKTAASWCARNKNVA